MIAETFQPPILPLTRWEDGSIRVGKTRILLELLIDAYHQGRSPEEIAISYPTLKLMETFCPLFFADCADATRSYSL